MIRLRSCFRWLKRRDAAQALRRDARGAAVIEMAFALPVFLVLMAGLFDLAHVIYVRSILNGAIRQVSRSGSLEAANTSSLDTYISAAVRRVAPNAVVTTTRQSYYSFADVDRPEKWNDGNSNGTCDAGESYVDENKNGSWDADIGRSGNGGAGDVVQYKVSVTFDRIFAFGTLLGGSKKYTIDATTVVKNQPFAYQPGYGSATGVCS